MKASELAQKSATELNDLLLALRKEQFELRIQHASGSLTGRHEIRRVRRDIARIKTMINQNSERKSAS